MCTCFFQFVARHSQSTGIENYFSLGFKARRVMNYQYEQRIKMRIVSVVENNNDIREYSKNVMIIIFLWSLNLELFMGIVRIVENNDMNIKYNQVVYWSE